MIRTIRGVAIAAFRERRVLFVRRGNPPWQGFWSLPGGRIEKGETVAAAARRELGEETGLAAARLRFVQSFFARPDPKDPQPDDRHFLSLFAAECPAGAAAAASDVTELAWRDVDALDDGEMVPEAAGLTRRAFAVLRAR